MTLNTNFSSQQYDFYINKGFSLYKVNYIEHNSPREYYYFLLPEELSQYKDKKITLLDKDTFIEDHLTYKHNIYYGKAKDFNLDFFIPFFCENLIHSKDMINNSHSYGAGKPHAFFDILISHLKFDELLKVVDNAGVRELKLFSQPIDTHKKLLTKFSKEETQIFWDRFLKPRKTELNKPGVAAKYHVFLLDTFGSENVEIFTPYFQKLKSLFAPVDINFLEHKELKTSTLLINLKGLIKSFHIGAWNESDYEKVFNVLTPAIKNFYNLEHSETNMVHKTKKHFRVLFSYTTDNFNEDILKQNITDFLHHLKSDFNSSYDVKSIETWLYQNKLDKSLPLKENNIALKRKI